MFRTPRPGPTASAKLFGGRWGVGWIVLLYASFGTLWILLSDRAVRLLFSDPNALMLASSLKGLVFILITAALLFATLHRHVQGLAASEQKFSKTFHMSPDAIDLTHMETGVLLEFNQSYVNMFGYTREELAGHSTLPSDLGIWVRAEDRAEHVALLKANGVLLARESLLRRKDGTTLVVLISSSVLEIKGEGYNLSLARDITAQKQAEAEQKRLQAELLHAEKLESLGSLAGGVAHDMNNVLAAIMGMASALREAQPGEAPQAKALDTIIRACTRGRDVVKSLLYFARKDLEAAGPVNLNAIAREMVQLLSYTTLRRVRISTDFQEPLALIEGDSGALSHALINLCVNAVDAMPDGGSLSLRTRQGADAVVTISIKDSGAGMSPELVRKATLPFFTTKPLGKGTGLGLAMVYGTVKAHKGSFEIRSEPGMGTEVILGFPPLAGPPAEAPGPARSAPMGPVRILLVDDDELIRMSVGPMLAALGHEVETAEGGLEALERFRAGLVTDLVILDMNMPGLNGAQTLIQLLELNPGQTVLMATGYSDESIAPLLEGRPNVFSLRKPFSLNEIRSKLESMFKAGRSS